MSYIQKIQKFSGSTEILFRLSAIFNAYFFDVYFLFVRKSLFKFLNVSIFFSSLGASFCQVVLLVLEVHACIAKDPQHFRELVVFLVNKFRVDNSLLKK